MPEGSITNYYEHKPQGAPKQMVMLLHGLGADGRDLIGLAPYFAKALPEAVFISPDAPYPCDMAPFGHQWFSLREWTPPAMLRGVQASAPILETFIAEQLEKYQLKAADLALAGFSQGTMISLYAAPRFKDKIAGILGYSGALVGNPEGHKPPICLIHGEFDTVVPVTAWHMAKISLETAGYTVSGHTTPGLPHAIDNRGIEAGAAFLKSLFSDR